jgi:type I restriction enzyme S subunit
MRFYKETNVKETEIGRIPKDWEVVRLGDIFTIRAGGDIYKLDFTKVKDEEYKFPIYSNSLENKGLYGYAKTYQYPENCITVTARGTLGYAIPRFEKFNAIIRLLVLIPEIDINIVFAAHYINEKIRFNFEKTSIPQLTAPKLSQYKLPLPPLSEQEKIAEILSTVDELIQRTDEIIAKTERLKKGLMQELLTKGIGHKEFKETEIGRIPKDWEVVRLEDIASIIMGQSPPSSTYNKEGRGLPFLQGKMEFGSTYPTFSVYTSKPIKIAEAGDILISVRAPVGDVNLSPFKLCIGRGLAATRCIPNKACYLYYFYFLQKIKELLEALGKGSTFKAIIKEDIVNLKVPLPPLSEQKKIAEILSTLDERIEIERKRREKLERIKKSLMDLLLTGKIRVRVD